MENIKELLFAAEVRKLAVKIANVERAKYSATLPDDDEREAKLSEWASTHTVGFYAEDAYNRIAVVADQLEGFEKARLAKKLEGNRYAGASQRSPITSSETETPPE